MRPLSALALALFLSAAALADERLERRTTWEIERPGAATEKAERRETAWVGDGRVRVDDRVSREAWIVRSDAGTITRIDHATETWCRWTFAQAAEERAAAAGDVRAALARVEGSDDEGRLRRLLEAFAPAEVPVALREGGAGPKTAGVETRAVALASKDGVVAEGRVGDVVGGLDRFARALGAAGLIPAAQAEAWAGSKGVLLAARWTLVFPDAIVREEFEVTRAEKVEAPEGTWDVPAGYREVRAPTLRPNGAAKEAPRGGFEGERPTGDEEGQEEEVVGEEAGRDE